MFKLVTSAWHSLLWHSKGVSLHHQVLGVMLGDFIRLFFYFQGDVILQCEHVFETVTKLCILANKQSLVKVVKGR